MLWISSIFICHIRREQRPKICHYLTSFNSLSSPMCVWCLCFLCLVPSSRYQAVVSFPITSTEPEAQLCWRGWALCHGFQQSQDFAWARSRVATFGRQVLLTPSARVAEREASGNRLGRFCLSRAVWHSLC